MPYIHEQLEQRFDRVRAHSPGGINRRIDATIEGTVAQLSRQGRDAIVKRLTELDREWDLDRALIAAYAVFGGATYLGGLARYAKRRPFAPRRKGLLFLVGAQIGFLMVHATAGWCPPVPLLRRLGFRTKTEIEAERFALLQALETSAKAA